MHRFHVAIVALILCATAAAAQQTPSFGGIGGRVREFLEGTPTTNEIARFYFWQEGENLMVKGWLGEKMSAEEAIFVKLQPVFKEKQKGRKKIKAKQLFPRMRKREEIDIEFPVAEELKVEARYATTGGRVQTGKTSYSKRFDVPPEGHSVEVLCQRTAGLEQCRCDAEVIEAVPSFPAPSG